MTSIETSNDHLTFGDLFDKATNYLLSVDALSSIDVPFKGETLRFTKNGNIISITSVK